MKNLILFLSIFIFGSGCGYESPKEYIIISNIKVHNNILCNYQTLPSAHSNHDAFIGHWYVNIIDTCGKYNIGDTIVFIKK